MNSSANRKITVLHLIDSLPREGAEVLLYDLIQRSDRDRFEFLVCALTRGGGVADMLAGIGVPVFVLGRRTFWDLAAFIRLLKLIRHHRVDIVHSHLFSSHLWGVLAARLTGVHRIFRTEHNLSGWKNRLRRVIDHLLCRCTDRIIAVSQPVRESLISVSRVNPEKVLVIENGLNLERLRFNISRVDKLRELGLPPSARLVGTAAALTPKKGHRYLLAAARRILPRYPDLHLLLMGEGELLEELRETIRAEGMEGRVRLLGSRSDALEIISLLNVFVLSSIREGLSIALLEAMALGRAVVITAVGGGVEVVENGVTGLLVPPADPEALAGALERVLTDPDLEAKLGGAAEKKIRSRYDIRLMVDNYAKQYVSARGAKIDVSEFQ